MPQCGAPFPFKAMILDPQFVDRERSVGRFEAALRRGEADLKGFLADEGAVLDRPARSALLVELVHAEVEFRLEGNEPVAVADYLERFPELEQAAGAVRSLE